MQDSQAVKSEIVRGLDRLSLDSLKMLAKFVTFLGDNGTQELQHLEDTATTIREPAQPIRVASPKLARPELAEDFNKEIVEITPDDRIQCD